MSTSGAGGQADVTAVPPEVEIILPAPRKWPVVILILLSLPLWGAVLLATLAAIARGFSGGGVALLMLLLWLAGWLVAGGCAVACLCWMLGGKEIVAVRAGKLVIRRQWRGYGRERVFNLAHVANLRAIPDRVGFFETLTSLRLVGLEGGKIAFDYIGLTEQCGVGIGEDEARLVVDKLAGFCIVLQSEQ